ncbi:MAG: hypothetical protein AAFZ15_13550 [Bacteroidota bacterium]
MLSTFRTIAKYERVILLRSWFFRIFSGLSLLFLFAFNMGEVSPVGDMQWAYRAVPSNMPYLNMFLLNIAQAIIAVFLSSEFIKRERKQDTAEVFYVRSMSNATYMLGKAWSILSIFLLINVAVLVMGLIFNSLALDTSIDWKAYLYYPLLISLPTLLYIIGLSTLMMSIIRNQALTFVILLGYIMSSLVYIKGSYNYLFDYMAFYLPLFHSELVGFTDWPTILTLRTMYACLGLGFLFFSIFNMKRLRQSRLANRLSLFLGVAFVGAGLFLGKQHWDRFQQSIGLPQQMIALNNQFVDHARIDIEEHKIHLEQAENSFAATSRIRGITEAAASEFVFTLNPGLEVKTVSAGERAVTFERQTHLLFVKADAELPAGTPLDLTIQYEGTIDEDGCYLDIDHKKKFEKPEGTVFDIGRRYAFVHPSFLLLTPENQWYPQAGVGYSDTSPNWYRKDFVQYQLTVKTLPGLIPVSQGNIQPMDENTYTFEPEMALPQISLSVGKYEKQSFQADSLKLSVYYTEGHNYFETALPDIRDTLESLIRERLADYERQAGLKYPFQEFSIVEVPGQFKSYDRVWTSVHQTVQPGLTYMPERGMYTRRLDFNGSAKRQKRWGRNKNSTPEEIQIKVLNQFLDEFFRFKEIDTSWEGGDAIVEESVNPYYQFAQFYELCNNLDSKQWPVLNRVFESYLRNDNSSGPDWARRYSGSTQNELANMVLQEKSFSEILTLKENQALIDNVIDLKGEMLFSMLQAKAGTSRFREFIVELLEANRFENLELTALDAQLQSEFGVSLSQYIAKWFNETDLPRYLIATPVAEKVVAGNREMTRVRFKVSNLGTAEGVIRSTLRTEEPLNKLLYLEPGETKETFYLSVEEPSGIQVNTLASGNLPNQVEYVFDQINKTSITNAREEQLALDRPITIVDNGREIIVDNENADFEFSHFEEMSRLRKWLRPAEEEDFKYKGTKVWRPPLNWTATTDDEFFGEFVRSAFYIKAGDGTKEAKWKIPITEPGRYDVFYHVFKDESFNWWRDQKGSYHFKIPHENGQDEPTIELSQQTPSGWTSLGDYEFAADTITISLTNETKLRAVFADAVKLVRMD